MYEDIYVYIYMHINRGACLFGFGVQAPNVLACGVWVTGTIVYSFQESRKVWSPWVLWEP